VTRVEIRRDTKKDAGSEMRDSKRSKRRFEWRDAGFEEIKRKMRVARFEMRKERRADQRYR
jgi:hypothetical protein